MYPQRMVRQALRLGLVVTLAVLLALSACGADAQQPPLPNPKIIALTFDDGPDPANTPKILDILQRHNVKATFFVVGQMVNDYPHLVRREYQEGHMVGNHSYTHPRLATLSSAGVKKSFGTRIRSSHLLAFLSQPCFVLLMGLQTPRLRAWPLLSE